ncbi:MAG: hypothetical protein WBD33_25390 [Xanthobacteraceae bacterium]
MRKADDNRRQAEQRIGDNNERAFAPETIDGQCRAERRSNREGA